MNTLTKIATEVETRDRNCLLKPRVVEQNKDNRVPLVITWHQKFKGLSKILHRHYNFMVIEHPDLQKVFPEPPIVSYRRNPNLHNHLVRTKPKENAKAGFSVRCTLEKTKKRGRPCKLCTHMGQKNEITNARTGKTCHIDGGSCNSKNVIYAACSHESQNFRYRGSFNAHHQSPKPKNQSNKQTGFRHIMIRFAAIN